MPVAEAVGPELRDEWLCSTSEGRGDSLSVYLAASTGRWKTRVSGPQDQTAVFMQAQPPDDNSISRPGLRVFASRLKIVTSAHSLNDSGWDFMALTLVERVGVVATKKRKLEKNYGSPVLSAGLEGSRCFTYFLRAS